MDKPIISDNFTVEDIHKIREYSYESTKHLSFEEKKELREKNLNTLAEEFPHIKQALERRKAAV